jgi:hypothetical protein
VLADTVSGYKPDAAVTFIAYAVVNSVVSLLDARYVEKSGRKIKNIKLGIWFWLIPVYLFQRARALGQSPTYFWVWIAALVGSIFISDPNLLSGNTYWGAGIPACDSSFASDQVKSAFKNIPLMRRSGMQALELRNQREVSTTNAVRTCQGLVNATNASEYSISYTIERKGDEIFTNVNIVQ